MRKLLVPAGILAVAGLALMPHRAPSQTTCSDDAARNLMATSLMDTLLNPSKAEDNEFFTSNRGGNPNLMFVIDTSGSMERLPPDGPGSLGGGGAARPAGAVIREFDSTSQQNTAFTGDRVVGCFLDATFTSTANVGDNAMLKAIEERRFYSPCGEAVDSTLIGDLYRGHVGLAPGGVDYAAQMVKCPYYIPSDSQKKGDPGFDPDYYPKSPTGTETTAGGTSPAFFGRDLVFHDSNYLGDDYGTTSTYAATTTSFKHNFGNGWTNDAVYPAKAGGSKATIDSFCDLQGTKAQGSSNRAAICKKCLKEAGWYYDGVVLEDVNQAQYPSVWYTGNYLNFFPPKFLVAKKIVKDVIAVQSKVRMALAHFDNSGTNQGAAFDQAFNPTCDMPDSSFDSNRSSYVNTVNALAFGGGTPLAESLFDVGRYYHSTNLPWFGTSWNETLPSGHNLDNKNKLAVCFSCQTSSVILLTDGEPNDDDGDSLPSKATTLADANGKKAGDTNTGIRGITSTVCPQCDNFSGGEEYKDNLAKLAWYLHNLDLRDDKEATTDCLTNGGKQVLDVYTVGFATSQLPSANKILSAAAAAGGGLFVAADNPAVLKQGLANIIEVINTRSTSFSVATVSTLQTTSGRAVIIPRFEPNKTSRWKGHLLRYDLYSEFVNACDAKADGTGTGDFDCDGSCTSVFLQDKPASSSDNPDFITEDGAGNFVKSGSEPTCTQAPRCQTTTGKTCSAPSSESADPWWDAGELLAGPPCSDAGCLSSPKWKSRTVWTVVDSNADGKIDRDDTVTRLQATDSVADAVIPYLGLGGGSVCEKLAQQLETAQDAASATGVRASQRDCAKTLIRLVLGADVFNSMGKKTGFPAASQDDLWDRDWILGDIFHSSPVVVDPPLPRKGVICPNGLSNQCLQSLWETPTKNGKEAYDGYAESDRYKNRRKVVLVGANDGLLHAFDGGGWHGNTTPGVHNDLADDPATPIGVLDESLPPFNGYFDRGSGRELWAFLPPDMISKLPLLLDAEHQLFVDGTPMVRDVWVDGTSNGLGSGSADDVKEEEEYHTVAVVGERRGGTHYFALDVTDATADGSEPGFLWIYPQPNDKESLDFGETYSDYLPRPPPIGPVRLEADSQTGVANSDTPRMALGASEVPYHERWVVFLNGGFDPQYLRGRGVHMADVWTGEELFDFSYSSDATKVQNALRFPVPSAVGMTGWGANVKRESGETNQFFFDTATFGDAGGQLWTLRFHEPGKVGADGRVTNWFGGRTFQMGVQSQACKFCAGQPFFNMTANIPLPTNGAYRVYAGSGDRYNLLDLSGGTCGPDNIRACVLRGCKVELLKDANLLESAELGSAKRGLSQSACNDMTSDQADGTAATCVVNGKAKVAIYCPSNASTATTTKDVQAGCTEEADGYACTRGTKADGAKLPDLTTPITLGNWFFSMLVFEETGDRAIFTDEAGAASYDGARLWLNQTGLDGAYRLSGTSTKSAGIVTIAASDTNPSTLATAESKGWAIYYNQGPTVTADSHTYNVHWADERSSSGSSTLGDIFWNTIQPASGEVTSNVGNGSCKVPKCGTIEARRIATKYGANVETGGLPLRLKDSSGAVVRAIRSSLLVPTQADQPTVFVNQRGEIAVGLTAVNPERGATNVGMTDPIDPSMDYGWMEVSESLHACRHAASAAAAVCK
jgi:type IV pilus assembly protein PilY1